MVVHVSEGATSQIQPLSQWHFIIAAVLITAVALAVYDQAMYHSQKSQMAGPKWKIPFVGAFVESTNPSFEGYMAKTCDSSVSCVAIFHKFIIFASDTDAARKILTTEHNARLCAVDAGKKFLGSDNFVFQTGRNHVEYRRSLNALFTRRALSLYLPALEPIYDQFFTRFITLSEDSHGQPRPFMLEFRRFMAVTACRAFLGNYLSDGEVFDIVEKMWRVTDAMELVNFPVTLPFTKTWRGQRAGLSVVAIFADCAARARTAMASRRDKTPRCVLEAWFEEMRDSGRENKDAQDTPTAGQKGARLKKQFTDREMAETLLIFMFAAQDANTSACTWLFQLVADHPEWLERVREENLRARNGDTEVPISMELLDKLLITRAVVRESLRLRPPAFVLPRAVKRDFEFSPGYRAKRGQLLIASLWPSLHDAQAFPDPDCFRPERWISGDADSQAKHWLVFGAGPHACLGQTYAQLNLIAIIGKASMLLDWRHHRTTESDLMKIFATIFPKDDCRLVFSRR